MTRRRGWVLAGSIGFVLLVAVAVWIWQSTTRPASAEDTALAYLHALGSGDVDALADVSADAPESALTAFAAAQDHIDDFAVTAVDESGSAATAEVSFTLADDRYSASITLAQSDRGWVVDSSGRGTLRTTATTGTFFAIGDSAFALGDDLSLFPATYAITAMPHELLGGESSVVVLPGETVETSIEVTLLPAALEAAQTALDEHLATCTQESESIPSSCGIRIPWGTEFAAINSIRYRIEASPVLALTAQRFDAEQGILVATVSGIGQDGADRTTTYRTESWFVRGDVAFTESGVTLTVW